MKEELYSKTVQVDEMPPRNGGWAHYLILSTPTDGTNILTIGKVSFLPDADAEGEPTVQQNVVGATVALSKECLYELHRLIEDWKESTLPL